MNSGYRIMGFHPDRISANNCDYAFRPGVSEEKKGTRRKNKLYCQTLTR